MGAMCAKCGLCCRAISVSSNKRYWREQWAWAEEWRDYVAAHPDWQAANPDTREPNWREALENRTFMLAHWHPISKAEADRRVPGITAWKAGPWYECDMHDAATNLCTAHDGRPPVCRDYPWYGRAPFAKGIEPLWRCSYWHDVPCEDWPEGTDPLASPGAADA